MLKLMQSTVFLFAALTLPGCYTDTTQKNTDGTPPGGVLWKVALSGPSIINVNDCVPYQVQLQDSTNNAMTSDVAVGVGLSQAAMGSFFVDGACAIPTTQVVIPAMTTSNMFYYKSTKAQAEVITATELTSSLLPASLNVLVDGASKLALAGPSTIGTNQCRQYALQTQNGAGVARAASTALTVLMSGAGTGSFYSDAACATSVTSLNVGLGSHTIYFYYRATTPQGLSIIANDNAGNLTSAALSVLVDGPTQISFQGPDALYVNQCGQFTVQSLNGSALASPVTVDTAVSFSGGTFYSDSNCLTSVTQRTLTTGNSQVFVYFKKPTSGTVNLTATTGVLGSVSRTLAVSGANGLVMAGPTSIFTNACAGYTLTSKDNGSDSVVIAPLAITLSGQGNGNFYSNSSCSSPTTTATIATGTAQVQFYYRANSAQSVSLMGSAPVGSPFGAAQLAVSASSAKVLAVTGSTSINKNTCSLYTVQARDNGGLAANVPFNVLVNLANSGSGSLYSSSACTTGISQVTIPVGSSSASFYFKSADTGTNFMVASDASGTLGSAGFIVDVNAQVAVLTLSDSPSYSYGEVAPGASAIKTFTVTNTGTASATAMAESTVEPLAAPFDFVGGTYPGTGGTCGATLSISGTCTIKVVYAPTAGGNFTDAVELQYHNGDNQVFLSRVLSGVSTAPIVSGQPDPTFSDDGILTHNLNGSGVTELIHGVAIQAPNGKILVAGTAENPSFADWDFALARYNANGTLDTTFGSNGVVMTDFRGGNDHAYAVALQSDGKIVAVGSSQNTSGQNQSIALARYSANGVLDSSFGSSGTGKVIRRVGTDFNVDELNAVAIDSSGRIVAAGRSDNNMLFVRYNSSGSLDTTFSGGASSGSTGLLKFTVTTGSHSALGMVLQSNGKILVTGYASNVGFTSSGILTVRLNTNGSLDTSFNGSGYITTPVGNSVDMGRGVAIDSSGRIVVVGATSNSLGVYNIVLVRYTSSGSLDSSFDADGKKITSLGSDASIGEAVSIQSDGKIVLAGYQWGSQDKFIVARYNTDGFLDTTFSGDGIVSVNGGRAHGMLIQSDGKIVAVGEASSRFAVMRLLP